METQDDGEQNNSQREALLWKSALLRCMLIAYFSLIY
jgi:hypothetical protein